jgi:hypothetical protein
MTRRQRPLQPLATKESRAFVEDQILRVHPTLRRAAVDEYWDLVGVWRADRRQRSAARDAQRFARLQDMVDLRLQRILGRYHRRVLFNRFRALRPAELPLLLGPDLTDPQLSLRVLHVATRAIALYGASGISSFRESDSVARVSPEEMWWLDRQAPLDLARLCGLSLLRLSAESGFRNAAKGLRLVIDPDGPDAKGPAAGIGWSFEPDEPLERAIADYDRRRMRTAASVSGLAAPGDWSSAPWFWPSIGAFSIPVRIDYPLLGRSHTTESFMWEPKDVTQRLQQLEDFPAEFTSAFGFPPGAFRSICRVLAEQIWHRCGLRELTPMPDPKEPSRLERLHMTSSLQQGDPRATAAPTYLNDLLAEGLLRASRKDWRAMLSERHPVFNPKGTERSVDSFIDVFTSDPGRDSRMLDPVLFHNLGGSYLALDLRLSNQFIDLCFHATTAGLADETGRRRGRMFEAQAIEHIREQLSLRDEDLPFPPNHKLRNTGLRDHEVDLCFTVGPVLVNIDMKSFCRSRDYHRGEHSVVRNRQSNLVKAFREQVDPRGLVLLDQVAAGRRVEAVVNLLCVADVEFVCPEISELWYGDTPRVLVPDEIVEFIQDSRRWSQAVQLARSPSP